MRLSPDADASAPPASPFASYQAVDGVFDEFATEAGEIRTHWEELSQTFSRLGAEELAARRDSARRTLREHGITYNVYADPQGLDRPWSLDLVPLVMPAAEWADLAAGLVQRARLLNAILADFYGPQRLVREGWLPPALLHANPAFLRSCHGVQPPRQTFLFHHAVDLARSRTGQWWALADRTQAPSGSGYALENRIVLGRVLPEAFRTCHVQRLAAFFQRQRDTLRSLAPRPGEQANVVLLTPGPYNETYFEHAFLARYLGFPLVEGGDLTVRDRRVFIKTLEGLQRVDVVMRRVDDGFCDPLELRSDSMLGVPGLLDAARAGNVTITNALGAGAIETPAIMAFLPGLCRHLLGESLILPSVATWWCGQERERSYVREHLDELVVKRAFSAMAAEPVFPETLNAAERERLLAALEESPFDFVGQERVALSTAPTWTTDHLEPRPLVLRAYVTATPEGYTAMPGGLTRVSGAAYHPVVSMQRGGGSKDTWVLAEEPVSPVTLLPVTPRVVRLERVAAEVPSRVADNLYWLGRYAERLEDTVRILRRPLVRLVGEGGGEQSPELTALVRLMVHLDLLPAPFREGFSLGQLDREILRLIYQVHRLGTVREVMGRLKSIAFVLRDRFSADTWRILTQLQVDVEARPGRIRAADALILLNTLILDLAALSGMEMENMTRGHAWRFLEIGRRLERAVNGLTLVQAGLGTADRSGTVLEPMLEIADSVMTYRRRYFAQPQWPTVLDLLLADESNPRSLAFQLHALADHLAHLPGDTTGPGRAPEREQLEAMRQGLQAADWPALAEMNEGGRDGELPALLARMVVELRGISDLITQRYFSHSDARTG